VDSIRPTPRNALLGLLADAMTGARNFGNRATIPQGVPLVGGQGLGNMLMGQAPEELDAWSYGDAPVRINPLAGLTAGYMPEVKRNRKQGLADLALLASPSKAGRGAALTALGAMDTGAMNKAATVWHGSPHKFDRFDSSRIGTGEGAQAYGHGLYLADAPAVAKEYAEKLSSAGLAKSKLAQSGGDIDAAISAAEASVQNYKALIAQGGGGDPRRAQGMLNLAEKKLGDLLAIRAGTLDEAGNLYKVDLPDEAIARMLDWDKPLSQQAPGVREALAAADRRAKDSLYGSGGEYYRALGARHAQNAPLHLSVDAAETAAQAPAASQLRALGIPGIRYLDGLSRGAGGTSNYVVFPGEENMLTILERNGRGLR
jgi:hypothetical protein